MRTCCRSLDRSCPRTATTPSSNRAAKYTRTSTNDAVPCHPTPPTAHRASTTASQSPLVAFCLFRSSSVRAPMTDRLWFILPRMHHIYKIIIFFAAPAATRNILCRPLVQLRARAHPKSRRGCTSRICCHTAPTATQLLGLFLFRTQYSFVRTTHACAPHPSVTSFHHLKSRHAGCALGLSFSLLMQFTSLSKKTRCPTSSTCARRDELE